MFRHQLRRTTKFISIVFVVLLTTTMMGSGIVGAGHQTDRGTDGPEQAWVAETGGGAVETSPTVSDGIMFNTNRTNGHLFAVDAETGERLWETDLNTRTYHSPAANNGKVYAENKNGLGVYDAETGEAIETVSLVGSITGDIRVNDNLVFVVTYGSDSPQAAQVDGSRAHVYAIHQSNNTVKWEKTFSNPVTKRFPAFETPGLDDEHVYVAAEETLYALNIDKPDGTEVGGTPTRLAWTHDYEGDTVDAPVAQEGGVYVGTDDHVYAFEASDGATRWTYTEDGVRFSRPAVGDGGVYALGDDTSNSAYGFDATTGSVLWVNDNRDYTGENAPTVYEGKVYYDHGFNVTAFDAETGALDWEYTEETTDFAHPEGTPVIVDDRLYTSREAEENTAFYALDLPDD